MAAAGCARPTGAAAGIDRDLHRFGEIADPSPPAAERDRREVVRQLLNGIVAGEDIALIERWLPGVEFRESQAAFFNGNLLLKRWDYAPQGRSGFDSIAVSLEFIPADDSAVNRIEQRTYEVTGQHGAWVVDRAVVDQLPP